MTCVNEAVIAVLLLLGHLGWVSSVTTQWADIKPPTVSHFMGFDPPTDMKRWEMALLKAINGEQVLLQRALKAIKTPNDIIVVDERMKWIFHNVDFTLIGGNEKNSPPWAKDVGPIVHAGGRAPIVMFGKHTFKDDRRKEGEMTSIETLPPHELYDTPEKLQLKERVVGVGLFNENWGWASTQFLNRSVSWRQNLGSGTEGPFEENFKFPQEILQSFLDKDEIIMMLVNQHNNITHPKLLSCPLGISRGSERNLYDAMHFVDNHNLTKHPNRLLLSISSDYAFRPAIRKCVEQNIPEHLWDTGGKKREAIGQNAFKKRLSLSYAVLCMPGLGVDTYRLWETLAMGSMPVMEKGLGLDRTVYKLPVLLVEDFADVTENILRQAYVEAMYIALDPCYADKELYGTPQCMTFELERITRPYWEELLWEASLTGSMASMLRKHPMNATDEGFTRPLVPFTCGSPGDERGGSGCGPGTKRTPKKSCGIDLNMDFKSYNYRYP